MPVDDAPLTLGRFKLRTTPLPTYTPGHAFYAQRQPDTTASSTDHLSADERAERDQRAKALLVESLRGPDGSASGSSTVNPTVATRDAKKGQGNDYGEELRKRKRAFESEMERLESLAPSAHNKEDGDEETTVVRPRVPPSPVARKGNAGSKSVGGSNSKGAAVKRRKSAMDEEEMPLPSLKRKGTSNAGGSTGRGKKNNGIDHLMVMQDSSPWPSEWILTGSLPQDDVVFVISGLVNPKRGLVRDKDWILDSHEVGMRLPEEDYAVGKSVKKQRKEEESDTEEDDSASDGGENDFGDPGGSSFKSAPSKAKRSASTAGKLDKPTYDVLDS
ncbi:hypothetical protein HK104_009801 [Borealophlyctis nickersoniae]|nr:hypothetical protein HK104_009801 [Borealophlyctis nickersoniae]